MSEHCLENIPESQLGDLCLAWYSFTAVPFPHAGALLLNITGIGITLLQVGRSRLPCRLA